MAMGKKKRRQQEDLWVATSELPRTAGHPFYERLNGLFNEHGFDDFVEGLCAKFYADKMGRPSLAPGVYFRLLLVGYFEGIGSERGIAWRASDSLGRGGTVCEVLCRQDGATEPGSGSVLSAAAGGVFRRDRIGTRNCLESQRFSGTARVSGIESERVAV